MRKSIISEVMREMGRKGGKIGGKKAAANMIPAERSACAEKAARPLGSRPVGSP